MLRSTAKFLPCFHLIKSVRYNEIMTAHYRYPPFWPPWSSFGTCHCSWAAESIMRQSNFWTHGSRHLQSWAEQGLWQRRESPDSSGLPCTLRGYSMSHVLWPVNEVRGVAHSEASAVYPHHDWQLLLQEALSLRRTHGQGWSHSNPHFVSHSTRSLITSRGTVPSFPGISARIRSAWGSPRLPGWSSTTQAAQAGYMGGPSWWRRRLRTSPWARAPSSLAWQTAVHPPEAQHREFLQRIVWITCKFSPVLYLCRRRFLSPDRWSASWLLWSVPREASAQWAPPWTCSETAWRTPAPGTVLASTRWRRVPSWRGCPRSRRTTPSRPQDTTRSPAKHGLHGSDAEQLLSTWATWLSLIM